MQQQMLPCVREFFAVREKEWKHFVCCFSPEGFKLKKRHTYWSSFGSLAVCACHEGFPGGSFCFLGWGNQRNQAPHISYADMSFVWQPLLTEELVKMQIMFSWRNAMLRGILEHHFGQKMQLSSQLHKCSTCHKQLLNVGSAAWRRLFWHNKEKRGRCKQQQGRKHRLWFTG